MFFVNSPHVKTVQFEEFRIGQEITKYHKTTMFGE